MSSAHDSSSTPARFVAGAIDLGDLKARAQAQGSHQQSRQQFTAAQVPGHAQTSAYPQGDSAVAGSGTSSSGFSLALAGVVTPESFEQDLVMLSTRVPVVFQLGSTRAPGSEDMQVEIASLVQAHARQALDAQEKPSWVFRYVDVDTEPEVAQALGVRAIPTVVALVAGRPMAQFEGVQPIADIERWVGAVLKAVAGQLPGLPADVQFSDLEQGEFHEAEEVQDPRIEQAASYINNGEYGEALKIYDELVEEDPQNKEWQLARRTVLIVQKQQSGESDEIDLLILEGNKAAAFELLIEQLRVLGGEERTAVQKRLIDLFSLFDAADPEVIAARTAMASVLLS